MIGPKVAESRERRAEGPDSPPAESPRLPVFRDLRSEHNRRRIAQTSQSLRKSRNHPTPRFGISVPPSLHSNPETPGNSAVPHSQVIGGPRSRRIGGLPGPFREKGLPKQRKPVSWTAPAFAIQLILLLVAVAPAGASTYTQIHDMIGGIKASSSARVIDVAHSRQGRQVLGVVITDPRSPVGSKARIVIIAGQHGDEQHPALSIAELALRWASGPDFEELRRRSIVAIIPDANPDGLARETRRNSSGADLNRDWDNLSQPETRGIARLIERWKPHLVLDEHEWVATDQRYTNCVELAQPHGRAGLISLAKRVRSQSVGSGFVAIDSRPDRDRLAAAPALRRCGIFGLSGRDGPE